MRHMQAKNYFSPYLCTEKRGELGIFPHVSVHDVIDK